MARKPVTADKDLHVRVTSAQLERWKAEAKKDLLTLSEWIKNTLNKASKGETSC